MELDPEMKVYDFLTEVAEEMQRTKSSGVELEVGFKGVHFKYEMKLVSYADKDIQCNDIK